MTIFRDALASSLTPFLDKARISFKEGEQYDDYDAIVELLYEKIIISSIKWAFADPDEIEIPAFGFEFDSEKHTAFIEASFGSNQGQYVFQDFSSERNFSDTVKCYPLGKTESLFSTESTYVSIKAWSFQLRYKKKTSSILHPH
jgi:hypothetical protein